MKLIKSDLELAMCVAARVFEVSIKDMVSERRDARHSHCRMCFALMVMGREQPYYYSCRRAGMAVNRDYSTVIYMRRAAKTLLEVQDRSFTPLFERAEAMYNRLLSWRKVCFKEDSNTKKIVRIGRYHWERRRGMMRLVTRNHKLRLFKNRQHAEAWARYAEMPDDALINVSPYPPYHIIRTVRGK